MVDNAQAMCCSNSDQVEVKGVSAVLQASAAVPTGHSGAAQGGNREFVNDQRRMN